MKRFLVVVGAASIALTATASKAHAQEFLSTSQFSGRIGAFFPIDEQLRDLENVWFSLGIDLETGEGFLAGSTTLISADWFTFSGGSQNNAFPVLLNQRWYMGEWPKRTYFHIGAGIAFTDFGQSDIVFAARAGAGLEFNERTFAEASFYWADEGANNVNVIGIGAYFGLRF